MELGVGAHGWGGSRRRESLPFFSLSILFTESSTSSSFSFAEYGSIKNVLHSLVISV